LKGVKNVKKKVLVLATVAILSLLMATIMVISQVGAFEKPDPKYVTYLEKSAFSSAGTVDTSHWTTTNPIIISEGHATRVTYSNVTVNGVLYTYPKDFDFNFTFHEEYNNVTGYGMYLAHVTFTFRYTVIGNMFESPSTLELLTEAKISGMVGTFTSMEFTGSCQLTGTLHFSNVQGYGISTYGNSTGFVATSVAWITGWPL
jgi:hypothetical protein